MAAVRTLGAAAALALLAAPAVAQAPRQTATDRFTTGLPGEPSGRSFAVDFADPADPEGKPPAISRVELELHEGARFDTAAVPRCAATDPELMARGPEACPADSALGTGEITLDTGLEGPARHPVFDVRYFNAADTLVIVLTQRGGGARTVLRGAVRANRLTIDVPPLPGAPPDGGANRRERATFAASPYLRTPPACPASGVWTNRVTYTYRDGVRQTASSTSPCAAGAARPPSTPDGPRLDVFRPGASARGLNRRRAIGVRLRVDGALRDVRVRLVSRRTGRSVASRSVAALDRDGRVVLRLRRRARAGTHVVRVRALDAGGAVVDAARVVRLR